MTNSSHYVEEPSLSVAWARAIAIASRCGREVAPLVVAFTGFHNGVPTESANIRAELDGLLIRHRSASVETVAGTIFPLSMWNPQCRASTLYDRYNSIYGHLRRIKANKNGTYFGRMIAGDREPQNQLDRVVRSYLEKPGGRRSKLQISIFDPSIDHRDEPYLGFPCLQHLSFAPNGDDELAVNAFYTMQYLIQKAYGNYLGLARLGAFVAHELGRRLTRVTCVAGIAQIEGSIRKRRITRADLKPFVEGAPGEGVREESDE